jgi:Cu/Ag efflux protein CusF
MLINSAFVVLALAFGTPAIADMRSASVPETEFPVSGLVVSVDTAASKVIIRPATLLGTMRIETITYRVRQAISLNGIRPGDRVSAVFSTRDGMLHRVRRVIGGDPARAIYSVH